MDRVNIIWTQQVVSRSVCVCVQTIYACNSNWWKKIPWIWRRVRKVMFKSLEVKKEGENPVIKLQSKKAKTNTQTKQAGGKELTGVVRDVWSLQAKPNDTLLSTRTQFLILPKQFYKWRIKDAGTGAYRDHSRSNYHILHLPFLGSLCLLSTDLWVDIYAYPSLNLVSFLHLYIFFFIKFGTL